jgi:hypothetical protein
MFFLFEFLVGKTCEFLSLTVPVAVTEFKAIMELVGIGPCPKWDFHERRKQEYTKTEFNGLARIHPRAPLQIHLFKQKILLG